MRRALLAVLMEEPVEELADLLADLLAIEPVQENLVKALAQRSAVWLHKDQVKALVKR